MEISEEDKERFWNKVNKTETCWLWTACCDMGYGQFGLNNKIHRAHRVSWLIAGNTIPNGHVIRHKCRAKNCVNPDHLETGTHAENSADMVRDGTVAKGEKHGSNKLTETQVMAIYASDKIHRELAAEFGVARQTISDIKSGRYWSWLTQ
jgi:hypothetical protein